MPQPTTTKSSYQEGGIALAASAIKHHQVQSVRRAAAIYEVPESTLRTRRAGVLPRRDCEANSKRLTKQEEVVIVQHILELDSRGFAPKLVFVREMANQLLAARSARPVGKNWPENFVRRTPEVKTRYNRKYDYQRALCEDPEVIQPWFDLVRNMIAKHGIAEADIYNFDETGFQMGVTSTAKVITGSDRRSQPKAVQPGNREWVTVIQGINAQGWAIPPFIIFSGTYHLSAWYEGNDIPPEWAIALSDNGWTNNKLGVEWLQHFDTHTKHRTIGTRRLLVIDGHESHDSIEFQDLCKAKNIITLCMPAHASHLLQPLDIACFAPLKRAYGRQVDELVRNHIHHVTKLEFLPAFKAAYQASITEANIRSGFRGAGLVPFNPDAVLSKLDVRLRTPTPPTLEAARWEPKTPSNATELGSQSAMLRDRIRQHQDSSPSSVIGRLDQLTRGAEQMVHSMVLLRAEVATLQKANETATQRRKRQKKHVQKGGVLTKANGLAILEQAGVDEQIDSETRQSKRRKTGDAPRQRRCGRCREAGHDSRNCEQVDE
jgi:DDE superfamily endonuclease/Psq-like protein